MQINTPECSALTDHGEVQEILRRASHQQSRPAVIEHRVLQNRSLSLHAGNPWVLGQLMSRREA